MNEKHFLLLDHADTFAPEHAKLNIAEIVKGIWTGDYQLFSCPYGIMLTEVVNGRLNLVRMTGTRMALFFNTISRDLQHHARELGCNAIETIVYSDKLARTLRRGGAKLESYTMVLELNDGQE
jgi:hypothetical protein